MTPGQARFWRVFGVLLVVAVAVLMLARQWTALLIAAVFVGWVVLGAGAYAWVMRAPRRYRRDREDQERADGLDPHTPPRRDHLASDAWDDLPTPRPSRDQSQDHDDGDDR